MTDTALVERWMRDANPIPDLDDVDADELTRAVAVVETRRAAAMHAPTQPPTRTEPTPATPPLPQRRRKAWAFVAAFIVVLVTVGLAALVLSRDTVPVGDEPVTPTAPTDAVEEDPPSATEPDADEPVTPTEPSHAGSPGWSRIPLDQNVFVASEPETVPEGLAGFQPMVTVTDVVASGRGLVVVGVAWAGQYGEDTAKVWTSPDGYTWSRVPHDPAVFGGGMIEAVTTGGPGLVAVGADTIRTSPDGYTWSRVPVDPAVLAPDDALRHVVAGPSGLVAFGLTVTDDATVTSAWTSPDGFTWSRVPDDGGVFGRSSVNAVAAAGPGFVAVGVDESNWPETWPETSPVIWTSPDGYTWSRVPHDEAAFGPVRADEVEINDVAAGGPGLVAVGDDLGAAAIWTSPDGYTWTRVPSDEGGFGDYTGLSKVAAGEAGLLAIGPRSRSVAFSSTDGITWNRVRPDPATFNNDHLGMHDVIAWDSGFLVRGSEYPDVAMWMVTPSSE